MKQLLRPAVIVFCILAVSSASSAPLIIPDEHKRPPEQTYLTFPEWYLVHSPAEYADFLECETPDAFPFLGHVRQFWQSYRAVWKETRDRYPVNLAYHVMVSVIGVSTTIEYGVKSAYETLVGRISLLISSDELTAEDQLAADVARDYAEFIRIDPWYKYDFGKRLAQVWMDTGFWGPNMFRKWERKYALTTEYAAKALYGWFIGKATGLGYEAPKHVTAAIVVAPSNQDSWAAAQMEILKKDAATGTALILLPRYQAFTTEALTLSSQGIEFTEIAGNQDEILISVIAPAAWSPEDQFGTMLLSQPVMTQPQKARYLMKVPITSLSAVLRALISENIEVEHIYDF